VRFYIQKVFLAVFLPATPTPLLMSSKSSANVSRNLKMAKMMMQNLNLRKRRLNFFD